jgi:Protein of unknown function (DUF3866)
VLKLRRAIVLEVLGQKASEQHLAIALATDTDHGEPQRAPRRAVADIGLMGLAQPGDELIVNTQALDLGLGSGGFDVVHVNLTRGLEGQGTPDAHVMKLNYSSLQHAVLPVERGEWSLPLERPVGVLALHGQLAPAAWAFARNGAKLRLGYVQTEGGALPGGRSVVVHTLLERGLLAGHISAGACFGGQLEAMTTAGALHHAFTQLGWDAAVCGPGPGIVGSASALGHGGLVALDSAHTTLALGASALLVARMSSADPRPRHRGISHHTLTVLDLLLEPVVVSLPAGMRSPVGTELRASLSGAFSREGSRTQGAEGDVSRPARLARHDWRRVPVDLPGYAEGELPAQTMGRGISEDPLFFAAALAGGSTLADLALHSAQAASETGKVA